MLRIVTGAFHPTLDDALVEDIRSIKVGNPFAPLAIIVPSSSLADRLKRLLAIESELPLLNVYVLTFHQFALRLREDLIQSGHPIPHMQLVDDFYFEQLLRHVMKRKLAGLEILSKLPPSPGTWKGLWATVRDLKDAVVHPETALKAVSEGLFEEDDRAWLRSLFTLYAAMLEASRSLGVGSADDLVASLGEDLSQSHFLTQFRRVYYFGFYDLLQVQLSFFESVIRCAPVTLYFPLGRSQSYAFSRRFFEQYLLPLAETHEDRSEASTVASLSDRVELTVTNVIGTEEELATVCREILTLVEVHGYRFDEIGVVARSFEPYRARLQSVFDRHLVPFTSTAGMPMWREPLVKMLLRLASLPLNNFERSAVLDVLTSPYYRAQEGTGLASELRPDVWRLAVSTLGITKGAAEWSRLSASTVTTILREASGEEESSRSCLQDPGQVALLASVVTRLIDHCGRLPQQGSIRRLTEAFRELVETHCAVPGWTEPKSPEGREQITPVLVGSLVKQALEDLSELDPVGTELSWEEWTELFQLALEETTLPIEGNSHQGVQVLDAMEARGLRFRALFMIGVNEQMFPRFIREDPFLRDRHRVVLASTLGFLIEEKLAGHEEEKLLFELLSRTATKRLYLSYQRADEEGRVMAPSAFVPAAQHDTHFITAPERLIPRRLTERVALQPAVQDVLPAQDLALTLLFHAQDVSSIFIHRGQDHSLFDHSLSAQQYMERDSQELGPFDGMLGSQVSRLQPLDQIGISPTALERYAMCPFQYYAERVLHLESVRTIGEDHLPALTLGTLIHDTLRLSYERLTALQWPEMALDPLTVQKVIMDAVAKVFTDHAITSGTGHALLWTMAQEQIITLIGCLVASDEEDYRATGYKPQAFETDAHGLVSLGSNTTNLKVHGTLDRIDVRQDPISLRVVDYKFKQGGEMESRDRSLVLSAIRGFRLQPPLYAAMDVPSLPPPSEVQFIYLAPRWKPSIARSVFERSQLLGNNGKAITQTIRTLVHGIAGGEFFILPDGYCDHCAYSAACRRHDQTVWWRSYRSPQARTLRRLRKLKVADE